MELFLMRHGIADKPQFYDSDRQRPLTDQGAQQHDRVIRILAPLIEPLDHLLTSPYTRARQTAEITAAALSCANPVEETDCLADDCSVDTVLHLLQQYPPSAHVLCVGHEPHMSHLSAVFLDGKGRSVISFQPGSVVSLAFRGHPQAGQGALRFFLQPAEVLLLAGQ